MEHGMTDNKTSKQLKKADKKALKKKAKALERIRKATKEYRKVIKDNFFKANETHAGEIRLSEKHTVILTKETGYVSIHVSSLTDTGLEAKIANEKNNPKMTIEEAKAAMAKMTTEKPNSDDSNETHATS